LAGVISIDIGAHESSGMVCGIVDASGYIGSIIIIFISAFYQFRIMFTIATIIGILVIITGIILFIYNYHKQKSFPCFETNKDFHASHLLLSQRNTTNDTNTS